MLSWEYSIFSIRIFPITWSWKNHHVHSPFRQFWEVFHFFINSLIVHFTICQKNMVMWWSWDLEQLHSGDFIPKVSKRGFTNTWPIVCNMKGKCYWNYNFIWYEGSCICTLWAWLATNVKVVHIGTFHSQKVTRLQESSQWINLLHGAWNF